MIDHHEPPALSRRLVVQPRARADIADAFSWYEAQAPGLGTEFVRALDAVLRRVQRAPELAAPVRGPVRRALLRRFPYGVFYRAYEDYLVVLAVLHARRSPARWPGRPAR